MIRGVDAFGATKMRGLKKNDSYEAGDPDPPNRGDCWHFLVCTTKM